MLKKASYYAAGLAAGAVLLTGFFALRGTAPKGLEAVLMAAGVSLAVGGGCGLLLKQEEKRHPQRARQERIEYMDERATLIRERAKAQAGNACSWLTWAWPTRSSGRTPRCGKQVSASASFAPITC